MIAELTASKEIGNYVLTSDIANFYDSISVDNLICKLRKKPQTLANTLMFWKLFSVSGTGGSLAILLLPKGFHKNCFLTQAECSRISIYKILIESLKNIATETALPMRAGQMTLYYLVSPQKY